MTMFRDSIVGNVKAKMSTSHVEIVCRYASSQAFAVLLIITSSAMPEIQVDVQKAINLSFFLFSET